MKLTKDQLEVRNFASKNDLHPELACICLKENKIVATDSYRLVEITDKKSEPLKEKILLSIRKIKLEKENNVEVSDDKKTATIKSKDLAQIVNVVDVKYPEYENIIPKDDKKILAEVKINGEYLAEVLEYAHKFGGSFNGVKVIVYEGNNTPIKIEAENTDYKVTGLVMPMSK